MANPHTLEIACAPVGQEGSHVVTGQATTHLHCRCSGFSKLIDVVMGLPLYYEHYKQIIEIV